jgi:hypothetical protein
MSQIRSRRRPTDMFLRTERLGRNGRFFFGGTVDDTVMLVYPKRLCFGVTKREFSRCS